MSWYYIHNSNKTISSTNPTLSKSTYSFKVEIGGIDCGTCTEQYKSNATTISKFKSTKQRLVFDNKNFSKVSIWCHARSSSPYGIIKTWIDVTEQFTIKTYPSAGIIDLQATNEFTWASSYVYLYVAIDEEFATKYTITNNNTNCVCNSEIKPEYEKNENITLEFTANEGYAFNGDSISLTTGSLNNTNVIYSNDRKRITLSGVIIDNLTINVTANKIYTVSITGTLKNCTCNYSDGEIITNDKILTITANSGYTFKGVYTYKENDGSTNSFNKNDEQTILTIDDIENWGTYNIELNDNYNATKISELVSGFVNLYRTNNNELMKLAKARFADNGGKTADYGEFITQLYVLPFTIPNDIIGEKGNIILGNYDSKVESTLITDSKLYIDGGTISVPNKYNNVYDYLNTTCTLRLPFFNPIIIDVDNVINKEITINYIIDLYSGNCTVNISSSFTSGIIHSETTNIVTQIPFIQKQNNSIVNRLSNVNENLIDTAFIEVVRNIPYYARDIFGKATIVFDTIGSVTGYCEVSDIQLITTATNEEKEQIESLLKDGIFIKESEV